MSQEYLFLESHARIADAQLSGALRAIDLVLEDIGQGLLELGGEFVEAHVFLAKRISGG